jgi:3-hydroxyisobutyrate dehydrogenase-like beta-hydroxyacid dehydrogenase
VRRPGGTAAGAGPADSVGDLVQVAIERGQYPAAFALRLMVKDFGLILRLAESLRVPMPATAAAQQTGIIEEARHGGREEDFSVVPRPPRELSGVQP